MYSLKQGFQSFGFLSIQTTLVQGFTDYSIVSTWIWLEVNSLIISFCTTFNKCVEVHNSKIQLIQLPFAACYNFG